jgi:hypothetical protein
MVLKVEGGSSCQAMNGVRGSDLGQERCCLLAVAAATPTRSSCTSPQWIDPPFCTVSRISITPPWCCGSSALAFAAAQAFLSNSYRYFPLGQCFRSAVSAGRRPHVQTRRSSTTENENPSQSRYCAPNLSLTLRALRIASKRPVVPSRPLPVGARSICRPLSLLSSSAQREHRTRRLTSITPPGPAAPPTPALRALSRPHS